MEDQRVKIVRKRLAVTGELALQNMDSAVFDTALDEAVKKFQKRHNLKPDGVVGIGSQAAMNVPVISRIKQIDHQYGTVSLVETSSAWTIAW